MSSVSRAAPTCRRCGKRIMWFKTPAGKWMPVDEGLVPYQADTNGKDILIDDCGRTVRCNLAFDGKPDGMARRSHWSTCPNADEFRRKEGGT